MPRKKKSVLEEEEEEDVFGDNEDVDAVERDTFYREVNDFMEKRGTPIPHDNLPQLGGRRLNVYKLWLQVWGRGGYEAVCENKQWTEVRDSYQVPKTCTSASYSLKMYYQKWLYAYEQVMKLGKVDPIQKQTPHVLEQQKQAASGGAVVKKVSTPAKKRVFTPSTGTASKARKIERDSVKKKQPSFYGSQSMLQLSHYNQLANMRKKQTDMDYSVMTIDNLVGAHECYSDGFYNLSSKSEANIVKEVEYARRIECSFKSADPALVEWAFTQVLRLSQNDQFRCEHVIGLLDYCEDALLNYATEIEKQNIHEDDDIFNKKSQTYLEFQHKAFIATMILRNSSFIKENQEVIGKHATIVDTLVFYLRNNIRDVLHIEWRLKIIDIIINVCEYIDFSLNNVLQRFVTSTLLDGNEQDPLLLAASGLETLNQMLYIKTNLPLLETLLVENPKIVETITGFLLTPSVLPKPEVFTEVEEEKPDEEEEETLENKDEQTDGTLTPAPIVDKKKILKPTHSTASRLSDIELLCRISSLNLLFKLCDQSKNTKLIDALTLTYGLIDRLVTLIVWKSNLYNRIEQYPYHVLKQVKESEKAKHAEGGDRNIFIKFSNEKSLFDEIDDYDEKNDLEEFYDGYDSNKLEESSVSEEEKNVTSKLADSIKFQKKCAVILQQISKKTEAPIALSQFSSTNKEFMYLILLTHPSVSKVLSSLIH